MVATASSLLRHTVHSDVRTISPLENSRPPQGLPVLSVGWCTSEPDSDTGIVRKMFGGRRGKLRLNSMIHLTRAVLLIGLVFLTRTHLTGAPAGMREITVSAPASRDLRQWDGVVTRMARAGELRLRRVATDTMMPGRSHERFDQYYRGVRVLGGDIVRQSNADVTVSIFGHLGRHAFTPDWRS